MVLLRKFVILTMLIFVAVPVAAQSYDKAEYQKMLEDARAMIKKAEKQVMTQGPFISAAPLEGHDRIVKTEIVKTEPLVKGQANNVTIRLYYEDDNSPVTEDRLQVIHTKPLHLLVNEPQLNDYKHKHPMSTDVPGEYKFAIVPDTDCAYRVWADMLPVDGSEQNTWAEIKGAEDCTAKPVDKSLNMNATQDGYQYMISMSTEELANEQDTMVHIDVMDAEGKAFMGLEPVMGAYAHLVGFYEDFETIAHIHPMGATPIDHSERGGPTLMFHIRPEKAGYVRFYLQLLIEGKMHFVPFGINIAEEGPFSGQDRMFEMMMEYQDSTMTHDMPMMNHEGMNMGTSAP